MVRNLTKRHIATALKDYHIIIDAGHGWNTPGKRSTNDELRENEFNSAVQDKVCYLLDRCGVNYTALANGWKDEDLDARVKEEHKIFETCGKKVLGVSIHADAFTLESANGYSVFYISNKGNKLADSIRKYMGIINNENNTIVKDRGSRKKSFKMLRETKGVWVLMECGFMTNNHDLKHLLSDAYRNDVADSIITGLVEYTN